MGKKILLNNKGSALAMMIIIATILSTLGIAVMTLGVVHFKMGEVDRKAKISFYMAESGLEQAYGIILKEVKEAVIAGNEAVEEAINAFLDEQKSKLAEEGESEYFITSEEGNYIIDEEKVMEELKSGKWDDAFKGAYKSYFKNPPASEPDLIAKLEDKENYESPHFDVTGGEGEVKPDIEVLSPADSSSFFTDASDKTELKLASRYEKEGVPQEVRMTFAIHIPMNVPENYYVNVVKKKVEANPVWNNALVAFDKIKITDSKELSEGRNVILGNVYAQNGIALSSLISAPDISNPLRITGNVATGTKLENRGPFANSGNVEIATGAQGCKMVINGNVYADNVLINTESDNNEIIIMKNVYTNDDLELNGSRAKISIEGNYYGFSDGSSSLKHDQSSGIVINAVDINQEGGSLLEITGSEVFINGVSYVDVVEPYPTGESVSIKGNYRAYSHYLVDDEYEYEFGYYNPLTLVKKQKEIALGEEGQWIDMEVPHKARYFYELCGGEPTDRPSWFNEGLNVKLPLAGQIYTLGTYINEGTVGKEGGWKVGDNVEGKVLEYSEAYEASLLNNFAEYIEIKNEYKKETESEYIFFSQLQDVYLIGPGGDPSVPVGSESKIIDSNTSIKGIIVTAGNVYLRGEINFSGLIVANGNIYIQDSIPKTIKFDKDYLRAVAGSLSAGDNPFVENTGQWEKQIYEKKFVGVMESASINTYKKYITIDAWEKKSN